MIDNYLSMCSKRRENINESRYEKQRDRDGCQEQLMQWDDRDCT